MKGEEGVGPVTFVPERENVRNDTDITNRVLSL